MDGQDGGFDKSKTGAHEDVMREVFSHHFAQEALMTILSHPSRLCKMRCFGVKHRTLSMGLLIAFILRLDVKCWCTWTTFAAAKW